MLLPAVRIIASFALLVSVAGCSSIVNTGAGELAGIAGAAVAGAVTHNPGVAAGIGLGAQAGTRAAVHYAQRQVHRAAQDRIAAAAGPLEVGAIAAWQTETRAPLQEGEEGRVTVSRVISVTSLECKEIIFSVDSIVDGDRRSAFYVAMVCRDGTAWKWASAEPSTERWGGLQ
jgi:hypothetical protein